MTGLINRSIGALLTYLIFVMKVDCWVWDDRSGLHSGLNKKLILFFYYILANFFSVPLSYNSFFKDDSETLVDSPSLEFFGN